MSDLLVSVVIPVGPDAESLGQCLDRVARQTYPNCEVLLVCDPRASGSAAVPKGSGEIKVVWETHPCTLGHLVNSGMRAARGEIKVLLMPHCAPVGEQWLQSMVEPFRDEQVGVVVGRCEVPDEVRRGLPVRLLHAVDPPQRPKPKGGPAPQNVVSHLCDAYRARMLRDIGYFDSEGLNGPGQAVDVSIKVAEAGRSIVLSDSAVALYNVPSDRRRLGGVMRQAIAYGHSDAVLDKQYEMRWLNTGIFGAALLSLGVVPLAFLSLPIAWVAAMALCLWAVFLAVRLPWVGWECPVAVVSFGAYVALVMAIRDGWWAPVLGKAMHPALIRQWCWLLAVTGSLLLLLLRAAAGSALRACRQPRGALYALPVFVLGTAWWLLAGLGYLRGRLAPAGQ